MGASGAYMLGYGSPLREDDGGTDCDNPRDYARPRKQNAMECAPRLIRHAVTCGPRALAIGIGERRALNKLGWKTEWESSADIARMMHMAKGSVWIYCSEAVS
jgi:hypothetical protein